ncbi:MAG: 3-hydroxyisobutyrate dehydrogenase [Pelagibacteraceae bacterium]|nr:MAG: 3-hydroxyisobutyrate dehydrogenase [Pelagibacteraceae bacterium]
MPTYKILFVGLGKMGFHMAGYLSKNKNFKLFVFNRTKSVEHKWKKKFIAESYNFKNDIKFDFIISCLKDDHAVNSFFNKFVKTSNFHKNSIIIDHSTISLRQIDLLSRSFKQRKVKFLDAPITGGEEGAKKGSLSVMVGGTKPNFNKSKRIISSYSKSITHMGKLGSGQLTKFTNQILICGILYSISEAYLFSKKNNLDQKKIFNAIKNGAANSWQFTNRYPTLTKNKFNFGFSTELMTKDLKYVLQQAKKSKLNLNLTKSVFKKYKSLQNTIYKKYDTSSLVKSFNDR